MALDFSLEIATKLEPENIAALIFQIEGFHAGPDDKCYFWAEGLSGGVREIDVISQEILQEEVGIVAHARVWYRLDFDNYEKGMKNGLRAFVSVLKHEKGDAVIRLNGDDVKLFRRNETMFLNSKSFSEDENAVWRFKDIPFPYEARELPAFM